MPISLQSGAWATSGGVPILGDSGVGSSSATTYLDPVKYNFETNDTARQYVPLNSIFETYDPPTDERASFVAPYTGRLLRVEAEAGTAAGSTVIGLHLNKSSTPIATITETVTAGAVHVWDFTGISSEITEDASVSISWNPSAASGRIQLTAIFEWDIE